MSFRDILERCCHLDIFVDDIDMAEATVLRLGARLLESVPGRGFRVFADPAGHPFCLCLHNPDNP